MSELSAAAGRTPTGLPMALMTIPLRPPAPIPPPVIQIALPDGTQAQIPGAQWPEPDIWAASRRRARAGAPPAVEIRALTRAEANVLSAQWHPLGAESRPFGYHAFALFVQDEPLALATAGTTHGPTVDRELGLHRRNVIELTRLCRAPETTHPQARGTLRVMLRLWRDQLAAQYWAYFPDTPKVALISYSLPGRAGHVYRTDGWWLARRCSGSGGGGTWSRPPAAGRAPEGLWVYWLDGPPASAAPVIARRQRERRARSEMDAADAIGRAA